MEKISGIIPRNSRNSSVDLSKSQPVRPGAPSFGRPIGKVTPRTFSDESTVKQESSAVATSDKFFIDNKQIRQAELSQLKSASSQEDPSNDRITLSPEVKELKKLQGESNEMELEILNRTEDKQASNSQITAPAGQSTKYTKKGEAVKAQIAEEVSRNFTRLEA